MGLERIVLIELNPRIPNSGSLLFIPRQGAVTVGSKMKEAGYDVTYLYEPLIGEISAEKVRSLSPDLVAFTSTTTALSRVEELASKLPEYPILIGGEHVSMFSVDLPWADYVIAGEGEHAAVSLLEALKNGSDIKSVPNLYYKDNGRIEHTFKVTPESNSIDYHTDLSIFNGWGNLGPMQKRRFRMPIQTSRGCPVACSFCVTPSLMGKKYRTRPVEDVLHDIEGGISHGINRFSITDNTFAYNTSYARNLLESIISKCYDASFNALVRSDLARHEDLIVLMSKAGIRNVSVGIESLDNTAQQDLRKRQDIKNVTMMVKKCREHGIDTLGLFMAGLDTDTPDSIQRIPEWAAKYGIAKLQISPLGIYPSTYNQVAPAYRQIQGIHLDYYNGHFVLIFPAKMPPSKVQLEIGKAYESFYGVRKGLQVAKGNLSNLRIMAGWVAMAYAERFVVNGEVKDANHIEFLRRVEHGLYKNGTLDEVLLKERYARNIKTDL